MKITKGMKLTAEQKAQRAESRRRNTEKWLNELDKQRPWLNELKNFRIRFGPLDKHRPSLPDELEQMRRAIASLEEKINSSVLIRLTHPQKSALLKLFSRHYSGDRLLPEGEQLFNGLRWFLQFGLQDVAAISEKINKLSDYRDAEGFTDHVAFTDGLIAKAVRDWKK